MYQIWRNLLPLTPVRLVITKKLQYHVLSEHSRICQTRSMNLHNWFQRLTMKRVRPLSLFDTNRQRLRGNIQHTTATCYRQHVSMQIDRSCLRLHSIDQMTRTTIYIHWRGVDTTQALLAICWSLLMSNIVVAMRFLHQLFHSKINNQHLEWSKWLYMKMTITHCVVKSTPFLQTLLTRTHHPNQI